MVEGVPNPERYKASRLWAGFSSPEAPLIFFCLTNVGLYGKMFLGENYDKSAVNFVIPEHGMKNKISIEISGELGIR